MKTRNAGLLAACGIAAASIALIAFLASRGGPPRTATGAASSNIAPPDIKNLPTSARGPDSDALLGGTGLFVQVMDRQDPTRLSSEIVSKSLEPLEAKNYRVDEPRAWIYLRDGRVVHVQSRQGRLHIPDRTREPDSGTLQGEVDIRMFAAPPPGGRVDLTKDTPIVRARTETLQFDGSLGEVSTHDAIKITSARTDFDGRGLRLLINQAQERIELLRVESDGVLRHRPSTGKEAAPGPVPAAHPIAAGEPAPAPAPSPPAPITPSAITPASPAPPAAAPAPTETFYHGVFSGPVKVAQAARSITNAQTMELWAHVVDNELIPGAIAGDEPGPQSEPDSPAPEPTPAETQPAPAPLDQPVTTPAAPAGIAAIPPSHDPSTPPPPAELRAGEDEVVVTWPGAMEIRPVEGRPEELMKDEVAVRFTAGPAQPVIALDEQSSSTVTADTITYGATRRAVTLTSGTFAKLERPGQGELRAPRIGIDTSTGIVDIPTRGELIAARREGAGSDIHPRSVSWNDNAQFQFDVVDGAMKESIRRATMIGSVLATDRGASLSGDTLQAWFTPDTAGRPVLQRLLVKQDAAARDAKDGSLTAGTLDVAFAGPAAGDDPTPRSVAASGQVHAERDGATIDCGELDAALIRGPDGEITVETVDARTRVRFARADGVHAEAEELHADAVKQVVDLTGDNSVVGKDADNVYGSQIRLDGLARTLEVFGAGRFEHETFDAAGLSIARADAAWTKGMTFDDRRGELNAAGQVVAVNEPDALTLETLRAERIKLFMTPLDESEAAVVELVPNPTPAPSPTAPDTATAKAGPAPTRAVLTAEAIGSDVERDDGVRATAELRRFESAAAKEAAASPQQVQYLESSRILVDNTKGTLHTPGPGKLLVVDRRRPAVAADSPQQPGQAPDTSRGDALFDWQGSMTMTRSDGVCRMEKSVKMAHSALADGALTELECETLTARIREQPGEAAPAVDLTGATREVNGSLVEADAVGAVFIRSQGKELLADGVKYNAEARTVEAWAAPANTVTVFDPGNPSPLIARRLFWDLAKDRIEVREAGTIVAPR